MSMWVGAMFEGVCHSSRGKTVFVPQRSIGEVPCVVKCSKSKEIKFCEMIRMRRFSDFWLQCLLLLISSIKFLRDASELLT